MRERRKQQTLKITTTIKYTTTLGKKPSLSYNCDEDNDNFIKQETLQHLSGTRPNLYSEINKLTESFPQISIQEMKNTLNSLKQKAPGNSEITKKHLTELPINIA